MKTLTFRRSCGSLSLWRFPHTPFPVRAGCVGKFFSTFLSDSLLGAWGWRTSVWLPWRGCAEWLRRGILCEILWLVENFRQPGESAGPCVWGTLVANHLWIRIHVEDLAVWQRCSPWHSTVDVVERRKKAISFRCSSGKRTWRASVVETRTQAHSSVTQPLHVDWPAVARRQKREQWRNLKTSSPCTWFSLVFFHTLRYWKTASSSSCCSILFHDLLHWRARDFLDNSDLMWF